jgi:hypothetical protein
MMNAFGGISNNARLDYLRRKPAKSIGPERLPGGDLHAAIIRQMFAMISLCRHPMNFT